MKLKLVLWLSCVTLFAGDKVLYLTNAITNADSSATLELYLNSNENARGFQVDIVYDTTVVSYDTIIGSEHIDGFILSANEPVKGLLKVLAISFSGQTIELGLKRIADIKFKGIDPANFKHTKISISNPVLSYANGVSLIPRSYPGYILSPNQSFLTVNRVQSSRYFDLVNTIDFAAMQFSFNYDTNIVTVDSVNGLARLSGLKFAWNEPEKGRIKIVINSNDNTLLTKGNGQIARIFHTIKDSTHSINDFSFSESFGVDASGLASQILPLESYHINSAPIIGTISDISGYEDTPVTIELTATDLEGDPITYSAKSSDASISPAVTGNSLTLTPSKDWSGTATITAYANDGASSDYTDFKATFEPVNDAPRFLSRPNTNAIANVTEYNYMPVVADIDNDKDSLLIQVPTLPNWLTFDGVGTISGSPDSTHVGTDSVVVNVSDGQLTTSQSFTITIYQLTYKNSPPQFTSVPKTKALEETKYTYNVSGSDEDGDNLEFFVRSFPDWLKVENDTSITGTPSNLDVGEDSVVILLKDGFYTVKQKFILKVQNINDAPVFTSVASASAIEDSAFSYVISATDPDGDNLIFSTPGLVDWLTFDGVNIINGTPTNDNVGDHAVVLVVTDGFVAVNLGLVITVTNVNDPPVFTSVPIEKVIADSAYKYTITATDPDGGDTTKLISAYGSEYKMPHVINNTSSIVIPNWLQRSPTNSYNNLDYLFGTPNAGHVGDHSVVLLATDGIDTVKQSFTITVYASNYLNNAPVFTSTPVTKAVEDSLYSYVVKYSDQDTADTLKLSATTMPSWLTLTGDSLLSGTPTNKDVKEHFVTLELTDGFTVVSQSFKITVEEVNDPPVFTSTPILIAVEDSLYSYTYSASDVDNADSTLVYAVKQSAGWLIFDGKNNISGTPTNDHVGDHPIIVTATDGMTIVEQSYTITVLNTNDPPLIASISSQTTNEEVPLEINVVISDVDGDTLTLGASADTSGINFVFENDLIKIVPVDHWNGQSLITVSVNDGTVSAQTTFSLTVTPVQDPPFAFDWVSAASDTIEISQSNLADTYELKWSVSEDVDGETIDYLLYAKIGVYPAEEIYDTTSTSIPITYQEFLENVFEPFPMLPRVTVQFSMEATDGIDTVKITGDNRVLLVNRYEYLSTLSEGIPIEFALHENYPNPFNPTTTLRFDLPELSDMTLIVYNMLGQKVKTFNMQSIPAGYHSVTWDATNDLGQQVGAGVYLYQLQAKDFVKTRKMVLLK